MLTQEILNNIQAKQKECEGINDAGIIIQGDKLTFSSVTLEWEISLEQDLKNCIVRQEDQSVLMPFPIAMAWDDTGRFRILIDKEPSIKDMKLVAGKSVINFYVSGTGQLQINDAIGRRLQRLPNGMMHLSVSWNCSLPKRWLIA